MSGRGSGWALVALGIVMLLAGVIGLLAGDGAAVPEAAETTLAAPITEPPVTTTAAPSTTTTVVTTTTTAATTTTAPPETVEDFVPLLAAAMAEDDEAFLFERLHPVVIEAHGEQLCRDWIAREIVELSDYRLVGEPGEPERATVDTPQGEREIELITAPVEFTFQGESFQADAGFSLLDGEMYWVGECR